MKKKQVMAVLLSMTLAAGMMTGCGAQKAEPAASQTQEMTQAQDTAQTSDTAQAPAVEGSITLKDGEWSDVFFNEEYQDDGMKTVKGGEIESDTILFEEAGCGIKFPQIWLDGSIKWFNDVPDENQLDVFLVRTDDYEKLMETSDAYKNGTATADERREAYNSAKDNAFRVFGIYGRDAKDNSALFSNSNYGTRFAFAEKIGTFADTEYYFVYNDTLPSEGYTDEENTQIQSLLDSLDEVRDGIVLFPAHEHDYEAENAKMMEQVSGIDLSDFEVTDLNGNTVTQDIFKDYDITMINIWATWCGPCRNELPAIQAAYEKLPENANIISICQDAAEETDVANAIINKTGIAFPVLIPNEQMNESVLSNVSAFPTTIFVDNEGHMIGKPQIGVPSGGDVTQLYLNLINSAMGQ